MKLKINRKNYSFSKFSEGSFTDLYKSKAFGKQQPLILKIINEKYQNKKIILDRFYLEQEILKDLKRTNFFPKLTTLGIHQNKPYLAYEYLEGTPLITSLKDWNTKQFTPNFCCDLILQLLTAISLLHNKTNPIVHSDISPENIIIENKNIHLIDLGCAQYFTHENLASKWIGKPSYLSPEQASGGKWGMQSDIYQIGIIFYECLTGKKWNLGQTQKQKIAFASNPQKINYNEIPLFLRPLLRSMLNVKLASREYDTGSSIRKLKIAMRAISKYLIDN